MTLTTGRWNIWKGQGSHRVQRMSALQSANDWIGMTIHFPTFESLTAHNHKPEADRMMQEGRVTSGECNVT